MKKICLIGCGGNGTGHADNWKEFSDIEKAGFCDVVPERAEALAKEHGGKAYTDFRKMFDEVQPSFVFISIPPDCHGEIEFEAIERGIPMFIEKPVTVDIKQACEIQRRIAAKKLITASGFQGRYATFNPIAKAFVDSHKIVTAHGSRIGSMVATPWFRERARSGGQVIEQAIHQLDAMRHLLGDADTVYTIGRQGYVDKSQWPGYDIDDTTASLITFKSGVVATFTSGVYLKPGAGYDNKLIFSACDARMEYSLLSNATIYKIGNEPEVHKNENKGGVVCDRTFIDAVITGDDSKILSPYSDAMKSVALTVAMAMSAESGKPVKIDDLYV